MRQSIFEMFPEWKKKYQNQSVGIRWRAISVRRACLKSSTWMIIWVPHISSRTLPPLGTKSSPACTIKSSLGYGSLDWCCLVHQTADVRQSLQRNDNFGQWIKAKSDDVTIMKQSTTYYEKNAPWDRIDWISALAPSSCSCINFISFNASSISWPDVPPK